MEISTLSLINIVQAVSRLGVEFCCREYRNFQGKKLQNKSTCSAAEAPHLEFTWCKSVASRVDLLYREPHIYHFFTPPPDLHQGKV